MTGQHEPLWKKTEVKSGVPDG